MNLNFGINCGYVDVLAGICAGRRMGSAPPGCR